MDGDADRAERLTCLEVVRDEGLPSAARGDVVAGLCAAMAALALGDTPAYGTAAQTVQGRTPYLPGGQGAPEDAAVLRKATLGEPYLRTLMLGLAAENRGDPKAARQLFKRAQLSALFFGARAAAAEARAGVLRTM